MSDRDARFTNDSLETTHTGVIIDTPSIIVPLSPEKNVIKIQKKKHLVRLFDAFCEEPDAVTFQTQDPDEKILLFLRKTQIVNIPWMLFTIIMAIIPIFFLTIKDRIFPFPIPSNLLLVSLIFYYLLTITYAFTNFIIWYFNAALITNKRIVDIDFHQLIYKDVAETKLSLVQDISYRQTSVISNLFDHGHVLIQTAGTIDNFEFYSLPKPEKIVETVENLIGKGRVYVP